MTIALDQDRAPRRGEVTAANDDHVVGHHAPGAFNPLHGTPPVAQATKTGGWDAYDVWRRLIKEARERRAGRSFPL